MPMPTVGGSKAFSRNLGWLSLALAVVALLSACSGRSKADKLASEGAILYKNQQYYKAVGKFEESLALQPNAPLVLSQCADAYLYTGKPAQAILYAEKAIKLKPELTSAYLILGQAHLKLASSEGNDKPLNPEEIAKADQVAHELRQKYPKSVEGLILQARLAQEQARGALLEGNQAAWHDHQSSATLLFQEAVRLAPENQAAYTGLAEVLLAQNKGAQAETQVRRVLAAQKDSPNPEVIRLLARSLLVQNKYDDAFETLEPYVRDKAPNPDLRNYELAGTVLLAQIQGLIGDQPTSHVIEIVTAPNEPNAADPGAAKQVALRQAVKRLGTYGKAMKNYYPNDPYAWFVRAVFYQLQGETAEAVRQYKRAIDLYEKSQNHPATQYRTALIGLYLQQGNIELARELLKSWMLETPDSTDAQLMLAQIFQAEGSYDDEVKALESLAQQQPNDRRIEFRLAQAYAGMGAVDKAQDRLRAMHQQYPDDPLISNALANILIQSTDDKDVEEGIALLAALAKSDDLVDGGKDILDGQAALSEMERLHNAGQNEAAQAKYQEAEQAFLRAAQAQPGNSSLPRILMNLAIRRNDLVTALVYARKARQLDPQFAVPEAVIYARLGQLDSARKIYEQMLNRNPESLELALSLAGVEAKLGQVDAARNRCDALIAKSPDDPRPYLLRASLAGQSADLDQTIEVLKNTLPRFDTNRPLRIALAQLYIKANRPNEASQILNEVYQNLEASVGALRLQPDQAAKMRQGNAVLLSLGMDRTMAALLTRQGGSEALAIADKTLGLAAQDLSLPAEQLPQLLTLKAIAQMQGGQPQAALATLDQIAPDRARAIPYGAVIRALALAAGGDSKKAAEAVAQGSGLSSNALVLFNRLLSVPGERLATVAPALALQVYLSTRPDFANVSLALADDNTKIMTNAAFLINRRGEALARLNRFDEALQACDEIQKLMPDYAQINVARADLHLSLAAQATAGKDEAKRQAELNKALELYQLYLKDQPNDPQALLQTASIEQSLNRTDEANKLYQQVIAIDPANWTAYNNLAWNLAQAKQLDQAAEQGAKALELAQAQKVAEIGGVQDTLGWIELSRGHLDRALELLAQATRNMPNNPEVRLHLAQALQQKGQTAQAVELLESITLAAPFYERIDEVNALLKQLKPAAPAVVTQVSATGGPVR